MMVGGAKLMSFAPTRKPNKIKAFGRAKIGCETERLKWIK